LEVAYDNKSVVYMLEKPLNFKGCGIDITLAFQVFEISAFEI
jgi:hypothetical protein